jgi:hypothetical protein
MQIDGQLIHGSVDDALRQIAIGTARLVLAVKGDTRDVRDLSKIEIGEISSVTRFENEKVESYYAELSGGDSLSVNRFLSGNFDGSVDCMRIIGRGVELPIDEKYFFELKNLYDKQISKK